LADDDDDEEYEGEMMEDEELEADHQVQ